jgi:cytochrome c-type biogenesis protein CcmE
LIHPKYRRPWLSALIGVIAILLTAGNVTLIVRRVSAPPIPWVSIRELARDQVGYTERTVRLEGTLVPGSLLRSTTCVYGFRLESEGATIPVHFAQCLPPHLFHREHVEYGLSAQGKLVSNWHFEAEQFLVRSGGPYRLHRPPPEPDTFDDWSSYPDAGAGDSNDASPR